MIWRLAKTETMEFKKWNQKLWSLESIKNLLIIIQRSTRPSHYKSRDMIIWNKKRLTFWETSDSDTAIHKRIFKSRQGIGLSRSYVRGEFEATNNLNGCKIHTFFFFGTSRKTERSEQELCGGASKNGVAEATEKCQLFKYFWLFQSF